MRNTLQEQYNLIKEGKGAKDVFLKHAKSLFPDLVPNHYEFNSASKILLQRGIISENMILNENLWGITTGSNKQPDWFKLFEEYTASTEEKDTKADASKTSKEVDEYKDKSYHNQYEAETGDDVIFDQYLNGIQIEVCKSENNGKTIDELKKIVLKNLKKDKLYYTKNAAFGVEGIGYTDEAPGLGKTKEVKGKYASSGMEPVKLSEAILKTYKYDVSSGNLNDVDVESFSSEEEAKKAAIAHHWEMAYDNGDTDLSKDEYISQTKFDELEPYNTVSYSIIPAKINEDIGMFMDPIGYKKSDPKPQVYTKKFVGISDKIKGDYVYDIFKNGVKVATIDGEGNANAWMNDQQRNMKEANMDIKESQLRSAIRQLIKEELNLKEIDTIGEEASKEAKIRKINEEISKRKKKLKALETLKELEDGSVNEKKLKELYSEIKKLEAAKNKLEKKGKKKEPIVDEALFDIDPSSNKDKPVAATSSASRIAITKAGGKMIPGTEDAK